MKYWEGAPPVHESVAVYLGIKAKASSDEPQQDDGALVAELLKAGFTLPAELTAAPQM